MVNEIVEKGEVESSQVATWIWSFAKPYRWSFINLFACVLITSFIGMLYPYIFGMLIDEVFYNGNMDFFVIIILVYGLIFSGEQALHFILNLTWSYLSTRFLFDIRKKLYEKILRMPAFYLDKAKTGDLTIRINQDSELVLKLVHSNIFGTFADSIRLTMAIAMVTFIQPKLALLMVITTPIVVYISRFFAGKLKGFTQKERSAYGNSSSWLFDLLDGMVQIRAMSGQRPVYKRFTGLWFNLTRIRNVSKMIQVSAERANSLVLLAVGTSLNILAAFFVVRGNLTVGEFVAVIDYFAVCSNRLKGISDTVLKAKQNMVSIRKVFSLLQYDEERDASTALDLKVEHGKILFNDVVFGYSSNEKVLKGLKLEINPCEKIALIGKSGAGKSTLIHLLLRLYEVTEGSIQIDGQDIRDCKLRSLRKSIGVVQQEAILFDGTIRENFERGMPGCTDDQIWAACEKAFISPFIRELPKQLDTLIGSEGIGLSGGQKQRISMARIFLKDPAIIVFDESTSALDYEAEEIIRHSWKELCKGRTAIIIAHRLSTFLDSDRVAVLQDGLISHCDHHSKLVESSAHYRSLFQEQYGSEQKGAVG
ncbi:ABC transporter ATP-binding protein [Paenibacillus humicus]|uniref:ABC transporter ATP-binding protein n=1 Tax=Paenibacillus humicus TaxID=412861 RepID=UPI000FDA7BEF|nr:ABC transporter ATP-binding protein [Paenibacillus humicus]